MKKEHYLAFCKHLHVCDLGFRTKVLQEIQAHYDNNPKAWNAHWKTSNAHVLYYEQGAESFLVEAMEWVLSSEGSQEVSKTWFPKRSVQ